VTSVLQLAPSGDVEPIIRPEERARVDRDCRLVREGSLPLGAGDPHRFDLPGLPGDEDGRGDLSWSEATSHGTLSEEQGRRAPSLTSLTPLVLEVPPRDTIPALAAGAQYSSDLGAFYLPAGWPIETVAPWLPPRIRLREPPTDWEVTRRRFARHLRAPSHLCERARTRYLGGLLRALTPPYREISAVSRCRPVLSPSDLNWLQRQVLQTHATVNCEIARRTSAFSVYQ